MAWRKSKLSFLLLYLCLFLLTPAYSFSQEGIGGASYHALIIGVLQWQDSSLAPFSKELRKDQELCDTLLERGLPQKNMSLLLDNEATLANIRKKLKERLAQCKEGDTFIFYYAGHGMRAESGHTYLANVEIDTNKKEKTGFSTKELSTTLQNFQGEKVILLADCCYSGALTEVAKDIAAKGKIAFALTSAAACNASTNNWTFTQAILNALQGKPIADCDGDGVITLAEVSAEVRNAMQYLEAQLSGFAAYKVIDSFVFATRTAEEKDVDYPQWAIEKALPPGTYVMAREGDETQWRPARLVPQRKGKKIGVSFYEYNKERQVFLGPEKVKKATFKVYPKGSNIRVIWGSSTWDAKVLDTKGSFHWITYPGWADHWNEWVMDDRIVGLKEELESKKECSVLWKKNWYKAMVLRQEKGRYFIHYKDFDNSWDEWVGPNRIRFTEGGKK